MRQTVWFVVLAGSWAACLVAAPEAQDSRAAKANMTQQLQSRFVLTKFSGFELKQAGTVLLVQKDGIGAVPGSGVGFTTASFGSNYKDGRIRRDLLSSLVANKTQGLRNLAVGEGVYLLRVQATDSNVILDVQACGACSPASAEPDPVRATVTFPFKKGFLENTPIEQILSTVGEVFTPANSNPVTEASPQPPGPPTEVAPPLPPATPATLPPAEPAREPVKIELGQTLEQVQAILGRPDKVVDLGAKKIYLYKDLKITFVDGLVSDVQ
jgi:hypothetical protein